MKIYRQGDVLLKRVRTVPKNALEKINNDNEKRIVLAYGEVTGHAHAISLAEAKEFTLEKAGVVVQRFLKVISEKGANLKHEEHSTIKLPKGVYEIVQQREYSPQEIRNVAD